MSSTLCLETQKPARGSKSLCIAWSFQSSNTAWVHPFVCFGASRHKQEHVCLFVEQLNIQVYVIVLSLFLNPQFKTMLAGPHLKPLHELTSKRIPFMAYGVDTQCVVLCGKPFSSVMPTNKQTHSYLQCFHSASVHPTGMTARKPKLVWGKHGLPILGCVFVWSL